MALALVVMIIIATKLLVCFRADQGVLQTNNKFFADGKQSGKTLPGRIKNNEPIIVWDHVVGTPSCSGLKQTATRKQLSFFLFFPPQQQQAFDVRREKDYEFVQFDPPSPYTLVVPTLPAWLLLFFIIREPIF